MLGSLEEKLFLVLLADLDRWEGRYKHMYLDTKGLVTTGIGNLVKTAGAAAALPFVIIPRGTAASDEEKSAGWGAVKAMPPGLRARAYESACQLRLTDVAVNVLVRERLDGEFLPHIRGRLPAFDAFPTQAKQALVDIAYNCGTGGFDAFHNMLEAAEKQDWVSCSKRCHRSSSREDRNVWCSAMFMYASSQPLFL
jgi:GH24 family phage-related lysozyme (muramidase)